MNANSPSDRRVFREGWAITDGHVAEYGHVRYLAAGPWWIGFGIRWCETLAGQIMPSRFSHAMAGSHPVRHWRLFWYLHITACRSGGKWWRWRFVYMRKLNRGAT